MKLKLRILSQIIFIQLLAIIQFSEAQQFFARIINFGGGSATNDPGTYRMGVSQSPGPTQPDTNWVLYEQFVMTQDYTFDDTQCNLIYDFGTVGVIVKGGKISFAKNDCSSIYFSTGAAFGSTSWWQQIVVGWIKSTGDAFIRLGTLQQANGTIPINTPHPLAFGCWKLGMTSAINSRIAIQETRIWSLTPSQFNSDDFITRYQSISWQYDQSSTPSSLVYYAWYTWAPGQNSLAQFKDTVLSSTSTYLLSCKYSGCMDYTSTARWYYPVTKKDITMQYTFWCRPGQYASIIPPSFYSPGNAPLSVNCQTCDSKCKECSTSSTHCYSCNNPYVYDPSTHTCGVPASCGIGQYNVDPFTCADCVSPCSTCFSAIQCTFCLPGYNYIDDWSFTCAPSTTCTPSTYLDSDYRICRNCNYPCLTCSGAPDYCLTCATGYNLVDGTCTMNCPETYYFDVALNTCKQCSSNCKQCRNGDAVCDKCFDGFALDTSTSTSAPTCVTDCPVGTYFDLISNTCMICQPDCAECVFNNYTCTACNPGKYLHDTSCIAQCPYEGYYPKISTPICDTCSSGCSICNKDGCISCSSGFQLYQGACIGTCPPQTYLSVISSQCFQCNPKCSICSGSFSTQCSQCNVGSYLLDTSCLDACPIGYYYDGSSNRVCLPCKYYCSECTSLTWCQVCKPGFKQLTLTTCEGEYFTTSTTTTNLVLPVNTTYASLTQQPAISIEFWFLMQNALSSSLEVIAGLTPYKIRKLQNIARIEILFNDMYSYCQSTSDLIENQWYHFAFTINSTSTSLLCYLNGQSYSIGSYPAVLITQTILPLLEITIGGTTNIQGSETNFEGYVKEFRWWNVVRSAFQINEFKNVALTTSIANLMAYWKLDEKNDGTSIRFKDSAINSTLVMKPWLSTPAFTVASRVNMSEIYLKICPEGSYSSYNSILGYYECLTCDSLCANCIGSTKFSCTQCYSPYVFLVDQMTCAIITDCVDGLYLDGVTGLCTTCDQYCQKCQLSPSFCSVCLPRTFRQPNGTSCVNICPTGQYGNVMTQKCMVQPQITSISPADNSVFLYGTIVDLIATFQTFNNEPSNTYSYRWEVIRKNGSVDISSDVIKTYYNTSKLKVHLDVQVLEIDNWYTITFYVEGVQAYYVNMGASQSIDIYFGSVPKSGSCNSNLNLGYATLTYFLFSADDWSDVVGISNYNFYFSIDEGDIFIPISSGNSQVNSVAFQFMSIYQDTRILIKCEVVNDIGFTSSLTTQIYLQARANADAQADLHALDPTVIYSESIALQQALSLYLIAQQIGNLNTTIQYFDPTIEKLQCTSDICNQNGKCLYQTMRKKYYCNCTGIIGGQNCTYTNKTELDIIKQKGAAIISQYMLISDKQLEIQFLSLLTTFRDTLSETTLFMSSSIIVSNILQWDSDEIQSQYTIQKFLLIMSNMIEYIEQDVVMRSATFNQTKTSQGLQDCYDTLLTMLDFIQANTLKQIDLYTSKTQFVTRMITYKQQSLSKDAIISFQASDRKSLDKQTLLKIDPTILSGISSPFDDPFIIQGTEFALNPYEFKNSTNIANNVIRIDILNYTTNKGASIDIQNLTTPFQLMFPISDNQNFSLFQQQYTALNPYRTADQAKRQSLIETSRLNCSFWNLTTSQWSSQGCVFGSIDATHLKCLCNHLTSFSSEFMTPQLVASQNSDTNDTSSNSTVDAAPITFKSKLISLITKPALYLLLLFWFLYFSSLIYYSGKDKQYRDKMTKSQIRDDLAEIKDDQIQQVEQQIRGMIVKGQVVNDEDEQNSVTQPDYNESKMELDHFKQDYPDTPSKQKKPLELFETMKLEEMTKYKSKAKKIAFGRPGSVSERAKRFYYKTLKDKDNFNPDPNHQKMEFFYGALRNNQWFGLVGKTSKIAPRHIRVTHMYFTIALHFLISSIIMMTSTFTYLTDVTILQEALVSIITIWSAIPFTLIMASIFRMPLSTRRLLEGTKMKNMNKAFKQADKKMKCRYIAGYIICILTYLVMTVATTYFLWFYSSDYCWQWFVTIFMICILDLIVLAFGVAAFQLFNSLLIKYVKWWINIWMVIEIFRYYKNLRG